MEENAERMAELMQNLNELVSRRVNEFILSLHDEISTLNEEFQTLREELKDPKQLNDNFQQVLEQNEKELNAMEWLFRDPGFVVHAQELKDFYATEERDSHSAYI
jgi:chromosome segregation ATPase